MKKAVLIVSIALVLICGGGAMMLKQFAAMKAAMVKPVPDYTVTKGNLVVSVVDSGTIDAVNSVEVKGRVSGRLKKLMVDEGDYVTQGQIIAIIDPLETQLLVDQNQAQLNGAQSATAKTGIEIQQRRVTAKAEYDQAQSRLKRVQMDLSAQPTLTSTAITEAQAEYNRNLRDRENLVKNDQPNNRTAAQTDQRDAEASFNNAKRDYERNQKLLEEGYVAGKSAEDAKLTMDLAKLKLDAATDKLGRIENQFELERAKADEAVRSSLAALQRAKANAIQDSTKREEYLQAISDVAKARAALADVPSLERTKEQNQATVAQLSSVLSDAKRQLHETEIRAPITGIVTKKELKEGELATGLSSFSAGTPIVRIEDRTILRVMLDMNEIDVAKMTEGMKAKITVDAFPQSSFTGYVKRIAPTSVAAAAGTTGTTGTSSDAVVKYEVEIRLDSNDKRLRSGMSAKCSLDVVNHKDVVVVPKDYVSKEGDKYYANIAPAAKGAQPEKREVTVTAESGAQYEIGSGLKAGDKLTKAKFAGPERKGMMQAGGPDDGG